MSATHEQVKALNEILGIIDQKATRFKQEKFDMRRSQFEAEKTMLLKLINDGLKLAENILPKPVDAIDDMKALRKQIESTN